jgi:predicted DsbA family dithiol-disulfide isomerase
MGDAVTASIHFQPFELNPGMHAGGENIDDFIGVRYGAGPAQLAVMRESLRERATAVGFEFNQNASSRIYNTFAAHQLLHWAAGTGRQQALKHALFHANFTANADVSSHEVLVAAAAEVGLEAREAGEVLTSGRCADAVREAEQLWISRGIQAVPAMVINGQWLVAGAQPPDVLENALRDISRQLLPLAAARRTSDR